MVDVKASPSQRRRSVEASESFDSFNKTSDSLSTSELIDPLGKISIWSVVHISETTEEEEERNISRSVRATQLSKANTVLLIWFDLYYEWANDGPLLFGFDPVVCTWNFVID